MSTVISPKFVADANRLDALANVNNPGILTLEVTLADLNVTLQVMVEDDEWIARIAEFNKNGEPTEHPVLGDVTPAIPGLVAQVPADNAADVPVWNSAHIRAVYEANPAYHG